MAVQVIFFQAKSMGSMDSPGVGAVRLREAITTPGSTTGTVRAGEAVMVFNGDGSPVLVAHGSEPDAAATEATAATTAGAPVGSTFSLVLVPEIDAKISVKALA